MNQHQSGAAPVPSVSEMLEHQAERLTALLNDAYSIESSLCGSSPSPTEASSQVFADNTIVGKIDANNRMLLEIERVISNTCAYL